MSGSQGRRDKVHLFWRTYFRLNNVRCHECDGPPYAADHDPPLYLYGGNKDLWAAAGGQYRSHCRTCSARQGGRIIAARKRKPRPSRQW